MKMLSLFFLLLVAPLFADEQNAWIGKIIPQLVLTTGKIYEGAKITKLDGFSATITHSGGIARIPMESFTPEQQAALGFDPEKAAAERKSLAEAAAEAQADALTRAATMPAAAEPTERGEPIVGTFEVVQVIEGGYLVSKHTRGGRAGTAASAMAAISGRTGGSFVEASTENRIYYLRGDTGQATADEDIIDVQYAELAETHTYDSLTGQVTVKVLDLLATKSAPGN